MKKKYEKPGLYVENFALSQAIATPCGAKPNGSLGKPSYADQGSCGWDMGNFIVWVETVNSPCNDYEDANTVVDGVCYNNPSPGNAIFSYS